MWIRSQYMKTLSVCGIARFSSLFLSHFCIHVTRLVTMGTFALSVIVLGPLRRDLKLKKRRHRSFLKSL